MKKRLVAGRRRLDVITVAGLLLLSTATVYAADPHSADMGHGHTAHHPAFASSAPHGGIWSNLVRVYTPRSVCMFGERPLIWLHIVSDSLIALAYYSIPLALIYFVRRRRDIAFGWMFWMFAGFILACGTTHVFGLWAIWQPLYWLDGLVKAGTAGLSIATAIALWFLIPHALMLRSPAQLERTVDDRTAELARTNDSLRQQITARKAAEERLAGIIGSAMDAIITIDEQQNITLFNGAAERMFRCAASEAIGQPLDRFIPPDLRQVHREHVRQFGETGVTVRAMQPHQRPLSAVRANGEVFPVEATISQIRHGEHRLFTAIVRDITDRVKAEQEREQLLASERAARGDSERANRLKDDFLATVSHELRTPLNAILGWSELLFKGSAPAEVQEGLEVIRRNARTQVQLVEDLLDLSRITSGKLRLDVQRVDLIEVIESALQTVEPAARAKEIRLKKVLDPMAGPVSGDPGRLQQVVWNLLSNAIKFTPKGGRVQVCLERINSHLELSVGDTGEGINPELLPHLFQRFRQGDASTTRRHGGLGIGLALVRHLVELHGGSVRADSAGEGKGATFTVCLPVRAVLPEKSDDRAHPTAWFPAAATALPSLEGIRVLAVDDERDTLGLLKHLLESAGANVTTATDATEGMELLRQQRPQLLLCDIGMPGEDGYSFMRRVRGLSPREGGATPAVALTAFARSEDRQRALMAGFDRHVTKPVESAELLVVVANLVSRARQLRDDVGGTRSTAEPSA